MAPDNEHITDEVNNRLDDLFGDDDNGPGGVAAEEAPSEENGIESAPENSSGIDSSLDDLFGSDASDKQPTRETSEMNIQEQQDDKQLGIDGLKSVVLSLEWEITDQVMQKLGEEILKLEEIYSKDKIVVAFLQLLGSLGKYIRKKRADAHPDSITLLQSVYENLEMIIRSEDMADSDKKKLLVSQVNTYKKLKEEIVVSRQSSPEKQPSSSPKSRPEPSENDDADYDGGAFDAHNEAPLGADKGADSQPYGETDNSNAAARHTELLSAIGNLQKTIQSGFEALIAELRSQK